MTEYTKGKWATSVWVEQPNNKTSPMVTAEGLPIAITHPCPAVRPEECQANANLIAAAPELYEALKALHENCEAPGKYLDAAGQALAKAEGKP